MLNVAVVSPDSKVGISLYTGMRLSADAYNTYKLGPGRDTTISGKRKTAFRKSMGVDEHCKHVLRHVEPSILQWPT